MNSKRIITLASFINKEDIVLDVGCDHGYLSIYLELNNLCHHVIASDISKNALSYAIKNINKYNLNIKTIISDGFKNINDDFNTAVIAGMGTSTIKSILKSPIKPDKLVLSTNNDYIELRYYMYKLGYTLEKEEVIKENNIYYPIMLYQKGKERFNLKKLLQVSVITKNTLNF